MRTVALLALSALLTACASARLMPAGVSGNELYVSVSNVWNEAEALPYATKHCAKYAKLPRLKEVKDYGAIFDCIMP